MAWLLQNNDYTESMRISTAWLYDRPITENIVANIGDLADNNPTLKVYIYCGTTQCMYPRSSGTGEGECGSEVCCDERHCKRKVGCSPSN